MSHKLGIGGSNAGTILGVNEWQTPLELYQRMKGLAPKPETNDLMVMGTLSEQGLRTLFERHHGAPIRQSHKLHRHRDHHWMVAHIDGLVQGENAGWEAKTATFRTFHKWGESGTDEVPLASRKLSSRLNRRSGMTTSSPAFLRHLRRSGTSDCCIPRLNRSRLCR